MPVLMPALCSLYWFLHVSIGAAVACITGVLVLPRPAGAAAAEQLGRACPSPAVLHCSPSAVPAGLLHTSSHPHLPLPLPCAAPVRPLRPARHRQGAAAHGWRDGWSG